ncbi:UNVERIFIED_CONTAM: lsm11 [Trichonephila clavipes]
MSDSERREDSRHRSSSRRDRSERRRDRRDSSSSRRSSPGTSRGHSPEQLPSGLPLEFGRGKPNIDEDETTVIKRMSTAFDITPLRRLAKHLKDEEKIIKVWTRNFKEIRGIAKGTLVCFDKHWNLIMKDVEEIYTKPKKTKTPFLLDSKIGDSFLEMPPKVPKIKKKDPEEENQENKAPEKPVQELTEELLELKKKRKERKKQKQFYKRNLPIVFIRGDNITAIGILEGGVDESSDKELLVRQLKTTC